jgi:Cell division protein CrgA
MARRTKEARAGAPPKATAAKTSGRVTSPSGRYTPPVPKEVKTSPVWVPVLLLALLILGMLVILLNYLGELPGGASNVYLLVGLGLITAGFITATKYH